LPLELLPHLQDMLCCHELQPPLSRRCRVATVPCPALTPNAMSQSISLFLSTSLWLFMPIVFFLPSTLFLHHQSRSIVCPTATQISPSPPLATESDPRTPSVRSSYFNHPSHPSILNRITAQTRSCGALPAQAPPSPTFQSHTTYCLNPPALLKSPWPANPGICPCSSRHIGLTSYCFRSIACLLCLNNQRSLDKLHNLLWRHPTDQSLATVSPQSRVSAWSATAIVTNCTSTPSAELLLSAS